MKSRFPILLVFLFLVADGASGATIVVRKDGTGDYLVIQQALNAASAGDTVMIGPGEFTESSMVRLDGYGWDVESFGHVQAPDLTIIGAGIGVTIIGPQIYRGVSSTASPKCLTYDLDAGALHVSDLTMRGCYEGVYVIGVLYMDRCQLIDNSLGVIWAHCGSGGWIKDTQIEVLASILSPMSFDIGFGGGNDVLIENCYFGSGGAIDSVQSATLQNCDHTGFSLYSGARAYVYNCRTLAGANISVGMTSGANAYCEIRDSRLRGVTAALVVSQSAPGGRYVVENCFIEGGTNGVLLSRDGAGACSLQNCDFVKGSGPMVKCDVSPTTVTHDLRNNYWGTSSEAEIQTWIVDRNDNPAIGATVLYSPFAGQSVPVEGTAWGDLKALFR